jgi:hypothetical protein
MNLQSKSSIRVLFQALQRVHHSVSSQDQQTRLLRFQDIQTHRFAEHVKQDNEINHDDSFKLCSEEAQSAAQRAF